jgi:endogenous inhibitor of DNA gyrase (YacG/DUF329 family)
MTKLKPCPFCGTDVEMKIADIEFNPNYEVNALLYTFEIKCDKCGCSKERHLKITFNPDLTVTLSEKDREKYDALIEEWNRRHGDE